MREKKTLNTLPYPWKERALKRLKEDMPNSPYFADWVVNNLNWSDIPVLNPWDYRKSYGVDRVGFHSGWVVTLSRLCVEYLKIKKQYPDNPRVWFVHKCLFCDKKAEQSRSHYKMKHWGLIHPCPPEYGSEQPRVVDPENPDQKYAGHLGRCQPTEMAFAFLANELKIPGVLYTFRDELLGMVDETKTRINAALALAQWHGFDRAALNDPPENVDEPACMVCGEFQIPFFYTKDKEVVCKECLVPAKNKLYTRLVRQFRGRIERQRKGSGKELSDKWHHDFESYIRSSKNGVDVEIYVDLDLKSKGAIVLTETTLRRFLNEREQRRRELAEERARKDQDA